MVLLSFLLFCKTYAHIAIKKNAHGVSEKNDKVRARFSFVLR
jgi:hypothetical protein